jgi:hypothetical protein
MCLVLMTGVLVCPQIVNKIICWEPDHNVSVSWLVVSESSVRQIECIAVASTSIAVRRYSHCEGDVGH